MALDVVRSDGVSRCAGVPGPWMSVVCGVLRSLVGILRLAIMECDGRCILHPWMFELSGMRCVVM